MMSSSPYDYPHDVELGLEPHPVLRTLVLPCGCVLLECEAVAHDVDACQEELADTLADEEAVHRDVQQWLDEWKEKGKP